MHLLGSLLVCVALSVCRLSAQPSLYEQLSIKPPAETTSPAVIDTLLGEAHTLLQRGESTDALRILFRIEREHSAHSGDPALRQLRLATLYLGLDLGESERGVAAAEAAMSSDTTGGMLAQALFSPELSYSESRHSALATLGEEIEKTPEHPLRDLYFLSRLRDAVNASAQLAGGSPISSKSLLAACLRKDTGGLAQATDELGRAMLTEVVLQRWPRPGEQEALRLKSALERLTLAEYALLGASKSPKDSFEWRAAEATILSLHHAFELGLLATDPFTGVPPGEALQHTLPALGLHRLGSFWHNMPTIPSRWSDSWKRVQFEVCTSLVSTLSDTKDRTLLAKHQPDAEALLRLAVQLVPSQAESVEYRIKTFNTTVATLNEEVHARRRAHEEELRRREEARRAARAAAEAEQRRREEAVAYSNTQYQRQQQQPPAQRWRWCMRCAGTGTYSQYSTRQSSYGGYERVQGQVRCDRCWGTGKLP